MISSFVLSRLLHYILSNDLRTFAGCYEVQNHFSGNPLWIFKHILPTIWEKNSKQHSFWPAEKCGSSQYECGQLELFLKKEKNIQKEPTTINSNFCTWCDVVFLVFYKLQCIAYEKDSPASGKQFFPTKLSKFIRNFHKVLVCFFFAALIFDSMLNV